MPSDSRVYNSEGQRGTIWQRSATLLPWSLGQHLFQCLCLVWHKMSCTSFQICTLGPKSFDFIKGHLLKKKKRGKACCMWFTLIDCLGRWEGQRVQQPLTSHPLHHRPQPQQVINAPPSHVSLASSAGVTGQLLYAFWPFAEAAIPPIDNVCRGDLSPQFWGRSVADLKR